MGLHFRRGAWGARSTKVLPLGFAFAIGMDQAISPCVCEKGGMNMFLGIGRIKIFAGRTGRPFAQKMCDYLDQKLGESETIVFSDGNIFVRIHETLRDKDCYIVQPIGEDPNNEFVELLFWLDAFKRASANSVTAIVPYFSYAKGDKKDEPRVSIRARVCAETIELAGADRVVTMELHSPQVQGFFKIPVDHLYATMLFEHYFRHNGYIDENLVVVSPDTGYAKRARVFAMKLGAPVAIADKMRFGHDENAEFMDIIGDIEGKNCLLVDDFSISGGTLVNVADELKKRGAKHIVAALSHCVLKEEGVKRIEDSPIEAVVTTDTVHCPALEGRSKFHVLSAAPLFAEAVRRTHDKEALGDLFIKMPERLLEHSLARQIDLF